MNTRQFSRPVVRLAYLWLCTMFVLASACDSGSKSAGPGDDRAFSVALSQSELTLGVGSSVALQALVRDDAGRSLSGRSVFWSSNDTTIAVVSPAGLVTAVRVGKVQIAATVGGRSAVANLTIAPRAVASVQLSPLQPGILVGGQVQLTARTLDAQGADLEGRVIEWSSSDPAVAVIDTTGTVTGISAGFSTIIARSEGHSASVGVTVSLVPIASIAVTPSEDAIVVGQTTQLTAQARDASGASLGQRSITWSTDNSSVATVSSSGLVIGVAPGIASITATAEGRSNQSRITVQPRPVSAVIVSPGQAALTVGQTVRLTLQITDDNGILLTGRPVQFRSDNPSIAQVAADGTVTGVAQGTTTITVTSEGRTGIATITVSPIPIASIRIDPSTTDLIVGANTRLSAVALSSSGAVLTQRVISWTSGSPSVATVSSDGSITAVGPGATVILASAEGQVGTATVNVRAIPVSAVAVTPPTGTVIIGDAMDLTYTARDANGNVIEGRPALWTSSDDRIAAVSSSGRVIGFSPGTVQITASVEGVRGTSSITVIVEPVTTITVVPSSIALFPTQTVQIAATPRSRTGAALTDRVVRFTSADPTIATVSATGLVTALRVGATRITVESEGQQVFIPVNISLAPVASLSVTLGSSSIAVGQTTQASALLRDALGNVLNGRTVTWSSSNETVATVSASGTITAVGPGTTVITGSSEAATGTATLTVTVAPVATVSVTLNPSTVPAGQQSQASAITRDAAGNVLTGRVISWTSSNASVATVNGSGVITTINPGTAIITGTSENKSGSATLTVGNAPVATVAVSLSASSITVGQTSQASATLRDAAGNLLTGRTVSWSSGNTAVATVNASGVVTATGAGSTSITATSEGRTGSATITIGAAPVASVTVTLNPAAVVVGQASQATATTKDAVGNTLTGRAVTWASSNEAVATVSATGAITALSPGTAIITATSENRSGTATLSVSNAPVASVSVTLDPTSIVAGGMSQATAITRDASGNVLTGRTVTWSSSNNSIATVDANGVVTAVSAGTVSIIGTSQNRSGSATLTVTPAPVATVSVSLSPSTVVVGQTSQATAVTRDAAGNVLTGRTVTWGSSDNSIATVNANGVVTPVGVGTAVITASSESRSGSATLTVNGAPVSTVSVSLTPTTVVEGSPSQATATLRDANGNELTGRDVTWSTSNAAIATVSSSGVVTTLQAGTVNIIATSENRTGSATLTVQQAAIARIEVTPATATIATTGPMSGRRVQLTATAYDANDRPLSGRTFTWSTNRSSVATVSANGLVSAVNIGSATITASSGSKSDTAIITVVRNP